MSFKGFVLLVALGLILFSCYQVRENNPFDHERLKDEEKKSGNSAEFYDYPRD
jgi:hypothetical protein